MDSIRSQMNNEVTVIPANQNVEIIAADPFEGLRIGDFYWVKCEPMNKHTEDESLFVEYLMCVKEIGSNRVRFTMFHGESTYDEKIHVEDFKRLCRQEKDWKSIIDGRMNTLKQQLQDATQQLIEAGKEYGVIASDAARNPGNNPLPIHVTDHKKYQAELVEFKASIPEIQKKVGYLATQFSAEAKNLWLPNKVMMAQVVNCLSVVDDKIFTIELYCGLQETIKQIADGKPASMDTKITVHQMMLFMDEETLFNYEQGGMDYEDVSGFDKWVVKPENLNRILPEQRGLVAMRIRRHDKDYGIAANIGEAWWFRMKNDANMQTYLLMRNGEKVYRIASSISFSPRLVPLPGEVERDPFLKQPSWYFCDRGPKPEPTVIDPGHIDFDDHLKKQDEVRKFYNRIAYLLQGLLDRSEVFNPHPRLSLGSPDDISEFIEVLRDEEKGLPCNKLTWKAYKEQLDKTIKVGTWVLLRRGYDARYECGESSGRYDHPKYGHMAAHAPKFMQVTAMNDKQIQVRWKRLWASSYRWVKGVWTNETDANCYAWVDRDEVFNVQGYTPGDYRMFLCDRYLKGE